MLLTFPFQPPLFLAFGSLPALDGVGFTERAANLVNHAVDLDLTDWVNASNIRRPNFESIQTGKCLATGQRVCVSGVPVEMSCVACYVEEPPPRFKGLKSGRVECPS